MNIQLFSAMVQGMGWFAEIDGDSMTADVYDSLTHDQQTGFFLYIGTVNLITGETSYA